MKILYPLLSIVLFVAIWAIAAAAVGVEIILPSPLAALREFLGLFADGGFWRSLGMSVARTLMGFCLSFVFAALLAVFAKLFEPFERFLSPIVTILRSVPTIAVILIVMVFMKSSSVPVLISFLIVFPMLYNDFLSALKGVNPEIAEMSKLYRVPKRIQIRKFYIPAVLPAVFTSSRNAIGLNLKIIVAAEAIAASKMSLGRLMQVANVNLESALLLAYTVMAILISFLLEAIVLLVRKLVVTWR